MARYQIDVNTGDIPLDENGQAVRTDDPTPNLYLSIGIAHGTFVGDPDLGSRIPTIVQGDAVPNLGAMLEQAGTDAIQRLVDSGVVSLDSVSFEEPRCLTIRTTEVRTTIPIEGL